MNRVHALKPVPHYTTVRETYCGRTCYPESGMTQEASTADGFILEFTDRVKEITCQKCKPGFLRDRS